MSTNSAVAKCTRILHFFLSGIEDSDCQTAMFMELPAVKSRMRIRLVGH